MQILSEDIIINLLARLAYGMHVNCFLKHKIRGAGWYGHDICARKTVQIRKLLFKQNYMSLISLRPCRWTSLLFFYCHTWIMFKSCSEECKELCYLKNSDCYYIDKLSHIESRSEREILTAIELQSQEFHLLHSPAPVF